MKRIAIGDIHLSCYKDDQLMDDGLPLRLHNTIAVVRKLCTFARNSGIKNIDILGDLCNDKDIIYTDSVNAFKDVLIEFSDLHFLILSGNHDMSSVGDFQTSAISVFSAYPNVSCYTTPVQIDNITVIPFSNKIVDDVNQFDGGDILLSHVGVSEATLQSGISVVSDVKLKDLSKWKLVLLGHYHSPQQLAREDCKLYYIGSLIHRNWNDKNEKKRCILYDSETLDVQSIAISGFSEYRELTIDDSTENPCDILKEAELLRSQGHRVRVRKKTSNKLDMKTDVVVVEDCEVELRDRGISISMDQAQRLKKHLENNGIDGDEAAEYLKCISSIIGLDISAICSGPEEISD